MTVPRDGVSMAGDVAGHVLVLAAFAAFVLWNGAIVVGDRDNHQVMTPRGYTQGVRAKSYPGVVK